MDSKIVQNSRAVCNGSKGEGSGGETRVNEKIQEQSALADALENAAANNANSKEEN